MEIPEAKGYSIWLLFEKNIEDFFQSIIYQLSSQFNSPEFIPHITLISRLEGNESELLKKFEQFSHLKSFKVETKKVSYSYEFYRSLFIEIDKSTELKNIFEFATKVFNIKIDFENFHPHISLLYSFEKSEVKLKVIEKSLQDIPKEIKISKMGFFKTKGRPEDWELLGVLKLKDC
ncbi:MAG: hypothetical protein ACPL25_11700 [Ignavibacteria bacterium]